MNRIPVFISFDYQHDLETKNRLVTEWADESCPVWIKDVSLPGSIMDHRWQTDAAKGIDAARAVLVICGRNTHSADGVKVELQMAYQKRNPIVFLKALQEGASLPAGVTKETKMVSLDWKSVYSALASIVNT